MDTIEERWPLADKRFKIRMKKAPEKVYLAPQQERLNFCYDGVNVEFVVPQIDGHQIVVMELSEVNGKR